MSVVGWIIVALAANAVIAEVAHLVGRRLHEMSKHYPEPRQ